MVILIVAIISSMAMPVYNYLKKFAQNAACVANLRGLFYGLHSYTQDHDRVWPQQPDSLDAEQDVSNWWFTALQPYINQQKSWICPSDFLQEQMRKQPNPPFISSYHVTPFDEVPDIAYTWYQPWAVEKYENHGKAHGPNMLMPDGAVKAGVSLLGN